MGYRNLNKDDVLLHNSEKVVLSRETVPESATMGHKSGEFTGRGGWVAREESSADEVRWKGIQYLPSMAWTPGAWHPLPAC